MTGSLPIQQLDSMQQLIYNSVARPLVCSQENNNAKDGILGIHIKLAELQSLSEPIDNVHA